MVGATPNGGPDYDVGYKRPPKASQFKPGQRGNPKGRPRGSQNLKAVLERVLRKKIEVRKGNKTSRVTLAEAIAEGFALKAAQGDRQAATFIVNLTLKTGALSEQNNTPNQSCESVRSRRASDAWVESIDPDRLSKDERIELSKITERLDDCGGVMGLDGDDLLRFQQLLNKGSGAEPNRDDAAKPDNSADAEEASRSGESASANGAALVGSEQPSAALKQKDPTNPKAQTPTQAQIADEAPSPENAPTSDSSSGRVV